MLSLIIQLKWTHAFGGEVLWLQEGPITSTNQRCILLAHIKMAFFQSLEVHSHTNKFNVIPIIHAWKDRRPQASPSALFSNVFPLVPYDLGSCVSMLLCISFFLVKGLAFMLYRCCSLNKPYHLKEENQTNIWLIA